MKEARVESSAFDVPVLMDKGQIDLTCLLFCSMKNTKLQKRQKQLKSLCAGYWFQ